MRGSKESFVNCQECRRHLYPYLDDELEITQNLTILGHLNCCRECRDIFTAEELSWKVVRDRLQGESLPPSIPRRIQAALLATDRERGRRRAIKVAAAVAALVLVVIGLSNLQVFSDASGDRSLEDRTGPALVVTRIRHDHGPGVNACMDSFARLVEEARQQKMDVLGRTFLERAGYRIASDEQQACLLGLLLGRDRGVDPTACETTTRVAYSRVDIAGRKGILHGIFDCDGQEVGIYVLSREDARVVGLHELLAGQNREIHLAGCRKCRVVAVSSGDRVWVLVTTRDMDPLVKFVRRVF